MQKQVEKACDGGVIPSYGFERLVDIPFDMRFCSLKMAFSV